MPYPLGIEPDIVQTGVAIGLEGRGPGQPPRQGRGAQDLARALDQFRGISRPDPLEVRTQVELTHVAADLRQSAFVHVLPVRDPGTARSKRSAELGRGLPDRGYDTHAGHHHAAHVIASTVHTHVDCQPSLKKIRLLIGASQPLDTTSRSLPPPPSTQRRGRCQAAVAPCPCRRANVRQPPAPSLERNTPVVP